MNFYADIIFLVYSREIESRPLTINLKHSYNHFMFLNHQDDAVGAAQEVHKAVFENEKVQVL